MIKHASISRYTAMRRPSSFRGIRPTGRNPGPDFDRRVLTRPFRPTFDGTSMDCSRNDRNGGGAKQRGKNVLADKL